MTPKFRVYLAALAAVIPLDQLSKWWVETKIPAGGWWTPFESLDGFFRVTHARNSGAAFGVAQGTNAWFFIGLTVLALVLIVRFFRQLPPGDRLSALPLGLITGGAIGNLIDRITRAGEVVDFLQFDLGLFIFPDFNFADSAIVIGVALLLLDVATHETQEGLSRGEGGAKS